MSKPIRVDDATAYVIKDLVGTFDSPNDVIQRLMEEAGLSEELEQARTEVTAGRDSDTDTYSVAVIENGSEIEMFTDTGRGAQARLMTEVTNYLIRDHELIAQISPLPYVSRGEKALVNDSKTHPDGSGMDGPKPLEGGYYIDTNHGSSAKIVRINDLAGECGLALEFGGGW